MGLLSGVCAPAAARPDEPFSAWLEGLGGAAQAASDGDFEASLQAARAALAARPRGGPAARARLAIGVALAGEGRHEEAARALRASLDGLDPGLRLHAEARLADALFYAGHPGAAAQAFAAVAGSGEGPAADRARWREADALLATGLAAPAARAFEGLLARSPRRAAAPAARLALAAASRALGDDARAVALYRQVWLEQPADPEGQAAGEALRAWRDAGGPVPEPSAAERLDRAERLLSFARPRLVLEALDPLDAATAPAPPLPRSALLRSLAFLQIGRLPEAEALARGLGARADAGREVADAAELVLARAAARQGRAAEAVASYRKIAATRPRVPGMSAQQQHDLPEDAAYLAAWLWYDAGDYRKAADALGRHARAHPESKRALDARWFRAWSLKRAGRTAEARRALAALAKGPLAAAALYWQARLAPEPDRQARLYRAAIREDEEGWYRLLASARLAALGEDSPGLSAPVPGRPLPEQAPDAAAGRGLALAADLLGAGMREEAMAELRALAQGREARARAPLVARLADLAGDPEIPFRMARDHLLPTARVLRWAHPQAFPGALAAAEGFGVDRWLLLAVMRRESSFRLDARSGAAAEGLLQLIPPTAERLATVLGVPVELASQIGEPATSIAFGAYYLGLLSARFPDVPALLAAYNAGPAAAAAWATLRAGLPLDEWVEDIPYRETRHYVRIVMADYALYRRLQGEPPPPLDPGARVKAPPPGVAF